MKSLIGRTGTFTDFNGNVFSCLVRECDRELLMVSYVRNGVFIPEAYIDIKNFDIDQHGTPRPKNRKAKKV